jgi:hypothetical protein
VKRSALILLVLLALLGAAAAHTAADGPRTRNLVLVTLDGVRVDEMFGGLDKAVLARTLGDARRVEDSTAYKRYWAPTREERREKLMPFFWGTLMREHGSILGDPGRGSHERLANAHRFSYPGYSELLTGQAHDDVIDSNDCGTNPYPSVLELLKQRLDLPRSQVAVFASWSAMKRIAEHQPGTIFVNAGAEAYDTPDPFVRRLSRIQLETTNESDSARRDGYTFEFAMAHLHTYHPRVLYVGFDETDGLAHEGRYADVLDALHRSDRWLRNLWETLSADPFYRGRTSLVITVDHGRGRSPEHWQEHGADIEGAQDVWTAFVAPESRRRGPWPAGPTVRHDQLAATLARLMGVDLAQQNPRAGAPIEALFTR